VDIKEIFRDPVKFCIYILNFKPTRYQEDLAWKFVKHQFVTARWCRQSGKSHMISALLLWYALTHPDSYLAVVGPSWRQTKFIIRRINSFLSNLPRRWYLKPRRTIVELKNGSRIECFPNNPETIRGPTLDVVYCDEMNFIPNDEEMFDAIMWTLVTKKHGKFICSSTPWNTDSVFWRIWNDPAFEHYAKSHITWRDALEPNGPLSKEMLEQIQRQYEGDPWRWTREMEAEWSEDADHWLPQSLIAQCVDGDLEFIEREFPAKGAFYLGVDLGKHLDYSVVAAIQRKDGDLYLIHCHRFPLETSYASIIGYIKALCDKWRTVQRICVDKTGLGDPIVEDMIQSGISNVEGINFTEQKKEEIATVLKRSMVEKHLKIPYDPDLINELNVERFEITKAGRIHFSHPKGTHDDRFWAVTLAAYAARRKPLTGLIGLGKAT